MKRALILSFSLFCLIFGTLAQASEYFAPENDLYIEADNSSFSAQGITEDEFWLAIETVEETMRPVLARLNKKISISANWFDGTVNAAASADRLFLSGGLARFPGITLGAYMGVICHEYGHSLKMRPLTVWSRLSAEGQSDYYAGLKCLRDVYKKHPHLLISNQDRSRLSRRHVEACNRNQTTWLGKQACSSSLKSGEEMAQLLYRLGNPGGSEDHKPLLSTPTLYQTPSTIVSGYPDVQCRLDSIAAGALCPSRNLREVVKKDSPYQVSCTNRQYIQPACWFNH